MIRHHADWPTADEIADGPFVLEQGDGTASDTDDEPEPEITGPEVYVGASGEKHEVLSLDNVLELEDIEVDMGDEDDVRAALADGRLRVSRATRGTWNWAV